MGNSVSNVDNQHQDLANTIQPLVAYYILTQNVTALKRLTDPKQCETLLALTKQVLGKYSSTTELDNMMTQHNINRSPSSPNEDKDHDSCHAMAKFFVKLAHLYAAIMTTVNPIYRYKDEQGNMIETQWFDKHNLSKQVSKRLIHMNMCSQRINQLKRWQNHGFVPDSCDLNKTQETQEQMNKTQETQDMEDKPGMMELIQLYYDSDYDVDTGQFMAMSSDAERAYQEDLQSFYHVFTNDTTTVGLPLHIKRFSDIRIQDADLICFSEAKGTVSEAKGTVSEAKGPAITPEAKGPVGTAITPEAEEDKARQESEAETSKDEKKQLLGMYANNLKQMIRTNHENQALLLRIVNQLFAYATPSDSLFSLPLQQQQPKSITIHPLLTEDKLNQLIKEAREIIVRMYLSCEINYLQGLKVYEAIVEHIMLDTSKQQLKHMHDKVDQLMVE